jgi:hypothetical protein
LAGLLSGEPQQFVVPCFCQIVLQLEQESILGSGFGCDMVSSVASMTGGG